MKKTTFLLGVGIGYLAADYIFPDGIVAGLQKGVDRANKWADNLNAGLGEEKDPGDIMTDRPKDPTGAPDKVTYSAFGRPVEEPKTPFTDTP